MRPLLVTALLLAAFAPLAVAHSGATFLVDGFGFHVGDHFAKLRVTSANAGSDWQTGEGGCTYFEVWQDHGPAYHWESACYQWGNNPQTAWLHFGTFDGTDAFIGGPMHVRITHLALAWEFEGPARGMP